MNQVIQLATRFVEDLRKDITPEQFVEVCKKNGTLEYQHSGVCASHDYCDANMVMLRAFTAVVGRPMIMEGDSPQEQADRDLWNAAWQYAHATKLRWGADPCPEYIDEKDFRVAISDDDGDTVSFYPSGGGFSYKMPRLTFFETFKVAPARTLRRGRVDADWMEDGETYPCWSDGSLWNGWSMPYFPREAVDKMIEQSKGGDLFPMWWSDPHHVIVREGETPEDEQAYTAVIMPNGELAWAVGAGSWCWNRVEFDKEQA